MASSVWRLQLVTGEVVYQVAHRRHCETFFAFWEPPAAPCCGTSTDLGSGQWLSIHHSLARQVAFAVLEH